MKKNYWSRSISLFSIVTGLLLTLSIPNTSHAANNALEEDWSILLSTSTHVNKAVKVIPTLDGGYLTLGNRMTRDTPYRTTLEFNKLTNQGQLDWAKRIQEPRLEAGSAVTAQDIIQTRDGGYVVGGYVKESAESSHSYLLKVNSSGQYQWSRRFTTHPSGESIQRVRETQDGGLILTASISNSVNHAGPVLFKTDSQGSDVWITTLTDYPGQEISDVIEKPEGGYIAVGLTLQDPNQNYATTSALLTLNAQGKVAGTSYIANHSGGIPQQIERVAEGGYIIRTSSGLNRLDAGGNSLWITPFQNFGSEISVQYTYLTIAKDGGYVLTGVDSQRTRQLHITKVSSQGNHAWTYHPTVTGFTTAGYGSATSDGGAILTYSTIDSQHLETLKLRPSSVQQGSFYLDSDAYSITIGDTLDTVALYKDGNGKVHNATAEAQYSSSNSAVASIDSQGNITGIKAGTATITATYKGITFTAPVLVVKPYVAIKSH
ncbi:hypothetical protein J2Z69_001983 [Paenibacillus shirakamiensis]|uniref:BIG2 domain-containing protein n=1 Tax=Paenibacillus shirakamiensis TaxID=1265935 RepID=A0ABS4JGT8_9BACL|nr:Ig-like domain-containing protein [Paenibacillus shirakamiensis]MBP2000940.1 hypothetical protein [Paenibacillus shirakamiensis]